jgi:hypothetical protein
LENAPKLVASPGQCRWPPLNISFSGNELQQKKSKKSKSKLKKKKK